MIDSKKKKKKNTASSLTPKTSVKKCESVKNEALMEENLHHLKIHQLSKGRTPNFTRLQRFPLPSCMSFMKLYV